MSAPKMVGTVGPGFTIKLTSNGKKVAVLKAGTYRVVVSDKASIHNFVIEHERGGKFEKQLTSVRFSGRETVSVTLKRGEWKYYCKPHESVMCGRDEVAKRDRRPVPGLPLYALGAPQPGRRPMTDSRSGQLTVPSETLASLMIAEACGVAG